MFWVRCIAEGEVKGASCFLSCYSSGKWWYHTSNRPIKVLHVCYLSSSSMFSHVTPLATTGILVPQARSQKLQLGSSFVQNCGLSNKFLWFFKQIVDLFDKFVAFTNKIVELLFERGSSAPREPPGYGPVSPNVTVTLHSYLFIVLLACRLPGSLWYPQYNAKSRLLKNQKSPIKFKIFV